MTKIKQDNQRWGKEERPTVLQHQKAARQGRQHRKRCWYRMKKEAKGPEPSIKVMSKAHSHTAAAL